VITLISLVTAIGLTISRLANTAVEVADFTFALVLLINECEFNP